jgi:hypothetical protein
LTRGDCRNSDDIKFTFNITLTGYNTTYQLEAWAGQADCAGQYANSPSTQTCWKLGTVKVNSDGMTASAIFHPKDLLGMDSGNAKRILTTCDDKISATARQNLQVYFLLTSSATVSASVNQQMYYDLTGPAAPATVEAGIAESSLHVKWSAVTDDKDITYQFYCAKVKGSCDSKSTNNAGGSSAGGSSAGGSSAGGSSAGGSSAGGSSAGGSSAGGSSAGGTSLTSGGSTDSGNEGTSSSFTIVGDYFKCGKVRGKANVSGYTDTILENDEQYAVTVVAIDLYGNESDKSAPACETPVLVDTFFENYRAEGGKAGGSFCSFGYGNRPLSHVGMFLLTLGAVTIFRRRRANQKH